LSGTGVSSAFWKGAGVPHVPQHSASLESCLESCGTPPQLTDDVSLWYPSSLFSLGVPASVAVA